jgi:hypothetical protein
MTRNLLRLAVLAFALATTFGLTPPRPAAAATCGSGEFLNKCTRKCCGSDVTTTYYSSGLGGSCTAARSACSSCLPACPAGQTVCGSTAGPCLY